MKKIALLWIALIFMVPLSTFADKSSPDAEKFVQQVSTKALSIVGAGESEEAMLSKLESLFESSVDIDWIAKFVLGQYYKGLTEADISHFKKSYREYLLKKYIPRFKNFTANEFKVTSSRSLGEGYYVVSSKVNDPEKSQLLNVEYRVKVMGGNSFQIRDISVEGISLILTQRSDFTNFLHNGSITDLIKKLDDRSFVIKQ